MIIFSLLLRFQFQRKKKNFFIFLLLKNEKAGKYQEKSAAFEWNFKTNCKECIILKSFSSFIVFYKKKYFEVPATYWPTNHSADICSYLCAYASFSSTVKLGIYFHSIKEKIHDMDCQV
uniref:Uncharacterized protein n=1 Tax=Cacopsylla melanoneura TaxID=428564 RepID=A0A8D8QUH0_9HEMI